MFSFYPVGTVLKGGKNKRFKIYRTRIFGLFPDYFDLLESHQPQGRASITELAEHNHGAHSGHGEFVWRIFLRALSTSCNNLYSSLWPL